MAKTFPFCTFPCCTLVISQALSLLLVASWPNLPVLAQTSSESSAVQEEASKFEAVGRSMGVEFRIVLYGTDEDQARVATQAAFDRVEKLNAVFSDYDADSETSRLSAAAGNKQFTKVSDEFWHLLKISRGIHRQTDGAFDITLGPLTKIWKQAIREQELPEDGSVQVALQAIGMHLIRLGPERQHVKLKAEHMRLDFGGIAKGHAADEALAVLRQHGFRQAFVDASGDIAIGDAPPGRDGWRVQIAAIDPKQLESRTMLVKNCGVATSGETYQFIEHDGKRYSHIVDPKTGYGVPGRNSVTVVAADAAHADAWASAISVMGVAGLARLEECDNVQAYVQSEIGGQVRAAKTSRFQPLFQSTNSATDEQSGDSSD